MNVANPTTIARECAGNVENELRRLIHTTPLAAFFDEDLERLCAGMRDFITLEAGRAVRAAVDLGQDLERRRVTVYDASRAYFLAMEAQNASAVGPLRHPTSAQVHDLLLKSGFRATPMDVLVELMRLGLPVLDAAMP